MVIKRALSLKHLLALLYVAALLLVVAMLINELRRDLLPFSLEGASRLEQSGHATISVYGENLHSGLKGVVAPNLINEKALLWRLMDGVSFREIDATGHLALASCFGNKLVSIEVRPGETPRLLGSLDLPADIMKVRIIGNRAVVSMQRNAGMALVDLRNPEAMKLDTLYPLAGTVTDMAAGRDTAYYVDMFRGIGRLDLAAEHPVPEILAEPPPSWCMTLLGNKLAVGSLRGGLVTLFNLSADGTPVAAGRLVLPADIRGVALTEKTLAVACSDGTGYFYNLRSWPELQERTELHLPGSPLRLYPGPDRETVAVSLVAAGVVLVDTRRPEAPYLSGELRIPATFNDIKFQSTKLWATAQDGLRVLDPDEIRHGEYAGQAPRALISSEYYQLYSWQGRQYGYRQGGLVDFGGKDPADRYSAEPFLAVADTNQVLLFARGSERAARMAGALPVTQGAVAALYREGLLYVLTHQGLQIFSGGTPERMHIVSELPLPGRCYNMAELNLGTLLVGTVQSGLLVVDVQDPARPAKLAMLGPEEGFLMTTDIQDILVDGQHAFVSTRVGGVHIIDLSNPGDPQLLQIIATPGYAAELSLHDDLLLVANQSGGVYMIDVRDRRHALPIGSLPAPLASEQIAVAGDQMILSHLRAGTVRVPVPQRLNNLEVVSRKELRADVARSGQGQYVYIYENGGAENVRVGLP